MDLFALMQVYGNKDGLAKHPPLLVTGLIRTGTTWLGKIIATHPSYRYISEPLNNINAGIYFPSRNLGFVHQVDAKDEQLKSDIEYRYGLRSTGSYFMNKLQELNSPKQQATFTLRFLKNRLCLGRGQQPLVKCPFSVFFAAQAASMWGFLPIFTLRHPAGFVSSMKSTGWGFPLGVLKKQQERFSAGLPSELFKELDELLAKPQKFYEDPIRSAAFLWNFYSAYLLHLRSAGLSMCTVQLEEMAEHPHETTSALFRALSLEIKPKTWKFLQETTSSQNPVHVDKQHAQSVKRDSKASIGKWKELLAPAEIDFIQAYCKAYWPHWYEEDSWQ